MVRDTYMLLYNAIGREMVLHVMMLKVGVKSISYLSSESVPRCQLGTGMMLKVGVKSI